MPHDWAANHGQFDDLAAFAIVARAGSYTRAAAELGMSTSMLSYTIKRLETRLGYPLLRRNSRSLSPTEAGERLFLKLTPALDAVGWALGEAGRAGEYVSGAVRLTTSREGYEIAIRPILLPFCNRYPDATVEIQIDYGYRDIIADRFDAGVRLGEKIEKDMVALKVGPKLRMSVVASPAYLARHPAPTTPQELEGHRCINYRMTSTGRLYAWEFEQTDRELEVSVRGPLVFNQPDLMLDAALDGLGVAYLLESTVKEHLAAGRLIALLPDFTAPFSGFHLYYPSRRQVSPVFAVFLDYLRKSPPPER